MCKTPGNLIIHCPERMEQVYQFADNTHQREQLEKQFIQLCSPWFGQEVYVHLYEDFAPFSFYFVVTADKLGRNSMYNGGLIYHGPHDGHGSGDAPTYSVTLTPASGWQIHT